MTRSFPRKKILLAILALAVVVLIAYFLVPTVGFFGDDWIFYELAGRLSLADYAAKYLDPNLQTAWYRPVQGFLFRLGYDVFGTNQVPYHLVNIVFHLANSILLFVISGERLGKWLAGFVASVLFATIPLASEAVFRTGVIDPVTTFVSLLTLWFWLRYLERETLRDYALTLFGFVIALLSKEIAAPLPVTLFLFDRLAVAKPTRLASLIRRYAPFVLIWLAYIPIEFIVTRRSVFVSREGYQPGLNLLSNLFAYLGALAFPWRYQPVLNSVVLVVVAGALAYLILIKRRYALFAVAAAAVLTILPVAAFPQPAFRFLYMPLTASAFLIGLLADSAFTRWRRIGSLRYGLGVVIVGLTVAGGLQIWQAAADYGEFSRVSRVPFRNFRQAHPTLPKDTLVYFVDPPVPGTNLSGMFFWFYGKDVVAFANDTGRRAGLREHSSAFVSYFDAAGNQKEQRIDKSASASANISTPLDFAAPIRLEGWEVANSTVKKGDPFILLLYWRGLAPMETDYVVSVDLIDSSNKMVQNWSKSPRGGAAPTSTWTPGEMVVDALQITVPDSATGNTWRLELALDDPGTAQRVPIRNASADSLVIQPLSVAP